MTLAYVDWPVRSESVTWIVTQGGFERGTLMVSISDTPQIVNDTTRSIRRNVPSITILPRPLHDVDETHFYAEDIDALTMSVSPWWEFGDGLRYQAGVFLFGDDSTRLWSSGSPRVCMLTDYCTVLDQPLDRSVGYAAGTPVNDAIENLLGEDVIVGGGGDEVGIAVAGPIESTDAVLGVAIGFAPGRDTVLTALDALFKIAGFLPPFYDNQGRLRGQSSPDVASATASFAYGAGDGFVIPGTPVFSNDMLTAPNRYVAIGGNTDAELVGIFDIPDAAPNSFVNTGRRIRKTADIQGIDTQAQADQAAASLYATDISSYTWLSFETARVEPRHDTWNIVSFDGVNYREVGWTIECKPGGHMTHQLRGAY